MPPPPQHTSRPAAAQGSFHIRKSCIDGRPCGRLHTFNTFLSVSRKDQIKITTLYLNYTHIAMERWSYFLMTGRKIARSLSAIVIVTLALAPRVAFCGSESVT